jgi:predicted phage terminase large subunit-like protein
MRSEKQYNRRYAYVCGACVEQIQNGLERLGVDLQRRDEERKAASASKRRAASNQRAKQHAQKQEEKEQRLDERINIELASRELARRSLLHYIERMYPEYQAGWVHEDICRRLEKFVKDVEDKKSPRLMLWLPPRAGKSELASARFPAWVLGKHPEWEFIMASYSSDLPMGFSRRVRAQVNDSEYANIFPQTKLSKDSASAESWRTTKGGGFRAAGVGGGITGMGAHIFVIDDPVKDQEQADSENNRELVWSWYSSTAYTRLAPGGGMLVIQTRWSDDDLSGRLERIMNDSRRTLAEEREDLMRSYNASLGGDTPDELMDRYHALLEQEQAFDQWEIVSYPALAIHDEYLDLQSGLIVRDEGLAEIPEHYRPLRRKGEALHSDRFPRSLLLKYKNTLQPRHWSALYQQQPVPDEGMFFTVDMFRYRPHLPQVSDLYTFAAWDLAIGQKNSNDYTVGIVGGIDPDDNLWILDMVRGRWGDLHKVAGMVLDLSVRYQCVLTGIEKGMLEMALRTHLSRLMRERRTFIPLAEGESALKPVTDKVVRARPLQGRMQQGTILFPSDQPWVEPLRSELLRFPTGVHDDIVDAMSWLVRLVAGHAPPPRDKFTGRHQLPTWRSRLSAFMSNGEEKNFMSR